MKTVLVKYKVWVSSDSWHIDDYQVSKSQIVEVKELIELNDMFKNITDVKIL